MSDEWGEGTIHWSLHRIPNSAFTIHHSRNARFPLPSSRQRPVRLAWPAGRVREQGVKTKPVAAPVKPATPPPQQHPLPKVIYRDGKVEEAPHPTQPGVILRRTIIDEVVVDEQQVQTDPSGGPRQGESK